MGTTDLEPADDQNQPTGPTEPTAPWAPPADPTAERPLAAGPPEPPTGPPASSSPPLPPPPAPPAPPTSSGTSPRKAALLGALAGGLVAALVATGITVALDDDAATSVDRPVVTPVTTKEGTLDIQAILAKVQPSVVSVKTSGTSAEGAFEGAGSGIVLSADGLVLTNSHVIGSVGDITVVLSDGSDHAATLVGQSPDDDLAVIQVQGVDDLVPAELGSSDDLRVGDEVIAIGNALNLGDEPTVTRGIVSAKDRDLTAEGVSLEGLIQTDAAINPGNSGGPLVNAAGQVVGMNTAIVADAQNLGFSIAIDVARPIVEALEAGEGQVTPDQAFLGVSSSDLSDLPDDVKSNFQVEVDEGAFITEVVPGSAADRAGPTRGDIVTRVGTVAAPTPEQVADAFDEAGAGARLLVAVTREGRHLVTTLDR